MNLAHTKPRRKESIMQITIIAPVLGEENNGPLWQHLISFVH